MKQRRFGWSLLLFTTICIGMNQPFAGYSQIPKSGKQSSSRPASPSPAISKPAAKVARPHTSILLAHRKQHHATYWRLYSPTRKPIVNVTSDVKGTTGTISLAIDLGLPTAIPSKLKVGNAPASLRFSRLQWLNLDRRHLPNGVLYSEDARTGQQSQPMLSIRLAIPASATAILPSLSHLEAVDLKNIHFLPEKTRLTDSTSSLIYKPAVYDRLVEPRLRVTRKTKFRSLEYVTLNIPLAEILGGGNVRVKKSFTATLAYNLPGGIGGASAQKFPDPTMYQIERKMVLNSADLTRFATPFRSSAGKLISTPRGPAQVQGSDTLQQFDLSLISWIDQSAPYVKLSVTRTGLYGTNNAEILSRTGIDVSSWSARSVRLFNHGHEVPIWIDTTTNGTVTAIEFYGARQPGFPSQYFNVETDTNAYWLTNSTKFTAPPLRYKLRSPRGQTSSTLTSGTIHLHHERDLILYFGDQDTTIAGDDTKVLQRTEWMGSRKFTWSELQSPANGDTSTVVDTFYVDQLPPNASGESAIFSTYLRGISIDTAQPNHAYAIYINGQQISTGGFGEYDSLAITVQVPLSVLHNGANTFKLQSTGVAAANDEFYFDYYDLQLEETLTPSSDTSIARNQLNFNEAGTASPFTISIASGDNVQLFNLTDTVRLKVSSVSSAFTTFADSTNSSSLSYAGTTATGLMHADAMTPWNVAGAGNWSILSTSHRTDYIVIAHPLFLQSAQRLQLLRQSAGVQGMTATTEEVFNAFNYGSNEAWAIRRFLQYAYNYYSGPPPSFVTLVGDATWDPKFNERTTIRRSYTPVYGAVVSDYIYTTFVLATADSIYSPGMVIARIPGSPGGVSNYIDKLAQYESEVPAAWNKRFLFVIGGGAGGADETYYLFLDELRDYAGAPGYGAICVRPMTVDTVVVKRQFFVPGVDYSQESNIAQKLQAGASILYFSGHGSPVFSDVSLGNPAYIRNDGLYPALITLSCQTGAFAWPNVDSSINEGFVTANRSGAILGFGTTGFGVTDFDLNVSQNLWVMMDDDSTNTDSTLNPPRKLNFAGLCFAAKVLSGTQDSANGAVAYSFEVPNSLNQYSILGDAMLGFAFRPEAELAILPSDVTFTNIDGSPRTVFSLADSELVVNATFRNFGYSAEGKVDIRIRDQGPRITRDTLISLVNGLDSFITVRAYFPIDTNAIGQHAFDLFIDYDNRYNEANENDNEITVNVQVNGSTITPLYPPEGARAFCDVSSDSVYLLMLAPISQTIKSGVLELQLDTTIQFTHPIELASALPVTSTIAQFTIPKSELPNSPSKVYWWRSKFTPGGDQPGPWLVQSFSTDQSTTSEFSYTSADQLRSIIVDDLLLTPKPSLILPLGDTTSIEVISHGNDDTTGQGRGNPVSYLYLNGKEVIDTSSGIDLLPITAAPIIAVVVLSADGTEIESVNEFLDDPNSTQAWQDSVASVFDSIITAIPNGRITLIFTNSDPIMQEFDKNPGVIAAMSSLGATTGFSRVNYFTSYALIGRKGAAPGSAIEGNGPDGGAGVTLFDTIITYNKFGVAQTPFTAVATKFGNLKWKGSAPNDSSEILFSILGHGRITGAIDTIITIKASTDSIFSLDTIDARQHDKIAVLMQFVRGSSSLVSPELSSIEIEYQPAPELAIQNQTLTVNPPKVVEGYPVHTNYTIQNLTCIPATSLTTELLSSYGGGAANPIAVHNGLTLAGHASQLILDTIQTFGLNGTDNLTAYVNPFEVQNEEYTLNNTASGSFTVSRDTTKPNLDITFDNNRHIYNCDYVANPPSFAVSLSEVTPVRVADSTIGLYLIDPLGRTLMIDSLFHLQFKTFPSGAVQAQLIATPIANKLLIPGQWMLTATGHDESGNTDTTEVCFTISATNGLLNVMNVPNPFKDQTAFTYQLLSGGNAEVKVVIYTITGRKIRTLYPDPGNPPHAGINFIAWDGRDESGNTVANGSYLYRVVLTGINPDGSQVSDAKTQTAVRSR